MKHKSGKWIIGHNESDRYVKEFGGCTGGPIEIDFKNKMVELC